MLQLKQRQTVEEGTENWDDDDFDIGGDSDFIFPSRATSVATTATGGFNLSTRRDHRDSITSRLSMRSDCEDDDESQVQVPGDDERSKNDAIAAAIRAGIPIPQNIPASALLGGTIKRLGGRKVKKVVQQDDWDDDLELPALGKGILTLRCHDPSEYPDALRHVSGPNPSSPMKRIDIPPTPEGEKDEFDMYATIKPTRSVQASILDRFRDNDDDDDMFGRGGETLKVTKRRMPKPMTLIQPPSPVKGEEKPDDDFASDLQLPHNKPLRLSIGRDIPAGKDVPKTPTISQDDFDEWGEGSLGTRFGGTRRSIGRSNSRSARSSSATMSPSISSSVTFESEDEGLDGIEIPTGPLDFGGLLKRRREMQTPEEPPSPPKPAQPAPKRPAAPPRLSSRDDFLSGLEIGDDDVFSKKLTLNRNVKVKTVRQTSPQRPKTVATLKFTDKPTAAAPVTSRLPRPLGHERHTSSLDPVSETAAPTTTRGIKRSQKLGGGFHTPNTSISIISTPQGTPTSSVNNSQMPPPSTPRRRALDAKPSFASLRNEPTTTSAQLLKVKRSMPIIRNTNSPAKPINPRYERPTSRNEATPVSTRPIPTGRKTPNESQSDRSGAESGMGGTLRRKPPPFLAGGSSAAQSHHITVKTSRHFRQNDSMSSNVSGEGYRSTSRTMSRAGLRSPSPAGQKSYATTGSMRLRGPEALAREAASKRQITKPTKKQHFGDGRELDGFDDLPTSSCIEQKYIKQPVARGPPKTLRNKVYNSGSSTLPTPVASSPARNENREPTLPRFARDTNASRMAREQVISQRHPSSGNPLGTLTNQWKAQVTARTGLQPLNTNTLRPKKPRQPVQKRPHLIKPMNDVAKTPKSVKGMTYNPTTFKWEGNENDPALNPFDALPSPQKVALALPDANAAPPPHVFREKENTTPRPALITNINASQGVQIVGGMVFDPQRMCWLKVPSKRGQSLTRGSLGGKCDDKDTLDGFEAFGVDDDDEEDVFKDVPDLEDRPTALTPTQGDFSSVKKSRTSGFGASEGGLKDEWLVGEEFDVGPEFVRRQREEEERWRRKVEKWVGTEKERGGGEEWRWGIRDVVGELGP